MEKIVITGGSGLVGQALIPILEAAGHEAVALRRPYTADSIRGATVLINLAGENLSAGRWTRDRKKRIRNSRVDTLNTLHELVQQDPSSLKTIISASASGFYGTANSDRIFSEDDPAGNDFLAGVCRDWESAADVFVPMGMRVVKIRIGVVLSEKGGALPKLLMPLKIGISVPLGSGSQWLPWIHIDDLTRIFLFALEHPELSGVYNAAAPNPVTNRQFMKFLAREKHRLYLPIGVPSFLLHAILGEMASVTLKGSRISPNKLIKNGFRFQVPVLENGVLFRNPPD